MLGQFGAEQPFIQPALGAAVFAADLKGGRAGARGTVANNARGDDDQWKRHREKEDADKSQCGEDQHRPALECAAADTLRRVSSEAARDHPSRDPLGMPPVFSFQVSGALTVNRGSPDSLPA